MAAAADAEVTSSTQRTCPDDVIKHMTASCTVTTTKRLETTTQLRRRNRDREAAAILHARSKRRNRQLAYNIFYLVVSELFNARFAAVPDCCSSTALCVVRCPSIHLCNTTLHYKFSETCRKLANQFAAVVCRNSIATALHVGLYANRVNSSLTLRAQPQLGY